MSNNRMPDAYTEIIRLLKTASAVEEIDSRREEIADLIPKIRITFGYDQHHVTHPYDLWIHTLHTVTGLPRELDDDMLYLGALLHDIGKPDCRVAGKDPSDTNMHYFGHPLRGMQIVRDEILPQLADRGVCLDEEDRRRLLYYVEFHDEQIGSDKVIRNILNRTQNYEQFHSLILLQLSDARAHAPVDIVKARIRLCERLAGSEGRRIYADFFGITEAENTLTLSGR